MAGRSSILQSRLALVKQKYGVFIQQAPPWGESATRQALGRALQREVCEADGAPVSLRRTGQANTSVHAGVDVPPYLQRDHQILGKAEILSQNMKQPQGLHIRSANSLLDRGLLGPGSSLGFGLNARPLAFVFLVHKADVLSGLLCGAVKFREAFFSVKALYTRWE